MPDIPMQDCSAFNGSDTCFFTPGHPCFVAEECLSTEYDEYLKEKRSADA